LTRLVGIGSRSIELWLASNGGHRFKEDITFDFVFVLLKDTVRLPIQLQIWML
jgi:hypothetical protein